VGAVLEDASFHPGRSARNHLRVLAITGNHPPHRVEEVLSAVGLSDAADRRVKGYSMGCVSGWRSPQPCSATRKS
jgi:ABC-2 type transport system ATP-binding protein